MERLYSQATAKGTQRSYRSGIRQYNLFCSQFSLPSIPTSERTLLLFATHLATRHLSSATIKVYMAAVRHAHITAGHHMIFDSQLTPRVQQLLKGIQKEFCITKPTRPRLPITPNIMAAIKRILHQQLTYQSTMLWAACCTAFFGFLRVSEFTVPSQQDYDPLYHLSLTDVLLDDRHATTTVRLYIKQSKTDPLRKGAYIYLTRTHQSVCPVQAIVKYLRVRGKQAGAFFVTSDGSSLTRTMFASALTKTLHKVNLNAKLYNTHSFRIGAATSANQAGVPDLHIKALGRWRSDAYQRYIRISPEALASMTKRLINQPDQ